MALRIAADYRIPVINLATVSSRQAFVRMLDISLAE